MLHHEVGSKLIHIAVIDAKHGLPRFVCSVTTNHGINQCGGNLHNAGYIKEIKIGCKLGINLDVIF